MRSRRGFSFCFLPSSCKQCFWKDSSLVKKIDEEQMKEPYRGTGNTRLLQKMFFGFPGVFQGMIYFKGKRFSFSTIYDINSLCNIQSLRDFVVICNVLFDRTRRHNLTLMIKLKFCVSFFGVFGHHSIHNDSKIQSSWIIINNCCLEEKCEIFGKELGCSIYKN